MKSSLVCIYSSMAVSWASLDNSQRHQLHALKPVNNQWIQNKTGFLLIIGSELVWPDDKVSQKNAVNNGVMNGSESNYSQAK